MIMDLLSLAIPVMQMMQGMNLMAEILMGAASLLSLPKGPRVVQEVPSITWAGASLLVLAVALTVGSKATGLVIAKPGTGKISATAVEKWAILKKTARTVLRISSEGDATQGPHHLSVEGAEAGVTAGATRVTVNRLLQGGMSLRKCLLQGGMIVALVSRKGGQ